MTAMVTNLLDMARIQSGDIRLRVEWQSLEEIIGSALKAAQGSLGPRRISVRIDPAVPLVECDAVLIERVLANLLENAGKYTPEHSPIEIIVRPDADAVRVSVQDRGPGVPAGQEDAIFDKFTRGNTESATPGMGLGLAICRAIIEAHHGRIWVETTLDNGQASGATFNFTLPRGTPPPVEMAELADTPLNLGQTQEP